MRMRRHAKIIDDAGGYQAFASRLAPDDGVLVNRARFWLKRDAIPAAAWKAVADAGLASLEELAAAAADPQISRHANDIVQAERAA